MSHEEIVARAEFLGTYYSVFMPFEEKTWDEMTPQEAYKRGQVMIVKYILEGAPVICPSCGARPNGEHAPDCQ